MQPNENAIPVLGANITGAEIYMAARETCSRLYIANGGSPHDTWTIEPYPGTAAIACVPNYFNQYGRPCNLWRLHMPAMPLDARLSRREADVMVGYEVHELGHALFTDFSVMEEARKEGLKHLLNGLEDIRIERDLNAMRASTNARELLEILTEYTTLQSLANGWKPELPSSLPFTLFQIGAVEVLGYRVPSMPPLTLPEPVGALAREAVSRVARASPGRTGTREVLEIARWLKTQLAALPKPANGSQPQPGPDGQESPQEPQDTGQGKAPSDNLPQESASQEASTAPQETDDARNESGESEDADDAAPGGARAGQDDGQDDASEQEAPDASSAPGGIGGNDTWDPSDASTASPETNVNDLGERLSRRAGQDPDAVARENRDAGEFLNAIPGKITRRRRLRSAPELAESITASIATPAKLRRDVTKALRAPEAFDNLRREGRGRFDMRDVTRAQAGAVNVFRRREESPGQSCAVALLLDMSSSMDGRGMEAAVSLALHLGDACQACSVPFEVLGFTQPPASANPQSGILEAKSFRDPWQEARPFVASMFQAAHGGTAMMPAMVDVSKRLRARAGVSRRIMIVLTDGADNFSAGSIRAAAKNALARDGVETILIGACHDVSHLRLPHVNVRDLRAVARDGLATLQAALASRPRGV